MKRVLIVDDAIDLGRLLQDALKVTRPDTPITVVPSAEEALLESTRFTFDLLITDLRLPGMSGLELIRKIRVRQPGIKVILITALMPEDRLVRQKDEVHPDIFIRKPISVMNFLESVDSLIGAPEVEEVLPQEETVLEPAEVIQAPVDLPPVLETPVAEVPVEIEPGAALVEGPVIQESAAISEPVAAVEQEGKPEPDLFSELAAVFPQKDSQAETQTTVQPGSIFPADQPAKPRVESVSEILAQLKGSLGASAALLANAQGSIITLAGDLPDETFQDQLIPAALASLNGGLAVTYLLGTASSSSVQAFRGVEYDLVIAPVGSCILMIVLPTGRSALRLAIAFDEALSAQEDLAIVQNYLEGESAGGIEDGLPQMEMLGLTKSLRDEDITAHLEETLLNMDPDLEKLNALVTGQLNGETKKEDPDSFWEAAAGSEGKETSLPGFLTYEQAQKLGLLNLDDEE